MKNNEIWTVERFYERLDALLKERNWSINQLAATMRVPHSSLYEMRRNGYMPRMNTLFLMCDALKITPYEFFFIDADLSNEAYYLINTLNMLPKRSQELLVELVKILLLKEGS